MKPGYVIGWGIGVIITAIVKWLLHMPTGNNYLLAHIGFLIIIIGLSKRDVI